MAWRKGLSFDLTTHRKVWIDIVPATLVSATPGAGIIPQGDSGGKIAAGWVPLLGISQIPVAADGEVSATKVVRADDSRLGNPPVGGDLSGTAGAASVVKLRGRTLAATAPTDGQVVAWNNAANQWQPATPTGGGGGGSITVAEADGTPSVTGVTTITVSNGTLTDNGSGVVTLNTGGAGRSVGEKLVIFERFR